jgi:ribosomal protein L28
MNKTCAICKRKPLKALKISHSKQATIRRQRLNLQKKTINGKRVNICAKCLKTLNKKQK